MTARTSFDADDIEGNLDATLDQGFAQRIGRAFAQVLGAERVVVGHDPRASSAGLAQAVKAGLIEAGVEVLDLGVCGTEEMYHATAYFEADGGITVTATHAAVTGGGLQERNGLKMVKAGSAPLDPATDLPKITTLAEYGIFALGKGKGEVRAAKAARAAYLRNVLSFIELPVMRPMKILVNAGNGAAGPTMDALALALSKKRVPLSFICVNHDADGAGADPLLPKTNR